MNDFANARLNDDFTALKTVYQRFLDSQATHGLAVHFITGNAAGTKLAKNLKEIDAFLARPDKATRIEQPNILRGLIGKFDAQSAFSSKTERGGRDSTLLGILNTLDPAEGFGPDMPIKHPQHEKEVLRIKERLERDNKERDDAFSNLHKSFQSLLITGLTSQNPAQMSYQGQAASRWIAQNIVGGEDIAKKIMAVAEDAFLIGYYANEGTGAAEGFRLVKLREERTVQKNSAPAARPA